MNTATYSPEDNKLRLYAGQNGYVDWHSVEADCYADAVIAVAPGNGAYKIEVIAV